MKVTVDASGRIVIPKSVRDALGLEAGSTLHLEATSRGDGGPAISLKPEREGSAFVRKGKGDVRVYTGEFVEGDLDIVAFIKEQRKERARRLVGFE